MIDGVIMVLTHVSVRPCSQNKKIHKWIKWLMLEGLWDWPKGSLMTDVYTVQLIIRRVSSMIHSARPTVVNIVFVWSFFWFVRFWEVGDGQHVQKQWSLPAEWINISTHFVSDMFSGTMRTRWWTMTLNAASQLQRTQTLKKLSLVSTSAKPRPKIRANTPASPPTQRTPPSLSSSPRKEVGRV